MPSVQNSLIWSHPFIPTARILIESTVLGQISQFRQAEHDKPESGGILLGYRREFHLHIVEATTPQRSDRRARFHFFRRDSHHQNLAVKRWKESNQTIDYLGEWHTHPQGLPVPSQLDLVEWRKIYNGAPPMLFIILGNRHIDWVGASMDNKLRRSQLLTGPLGDV